MRSLEKAISISQTRKNKQQRVTVSLTFVVRKRLKPQTLEVRYKPIPGKHRTAETEELHEHVAAF